MKPSEHTFHLTQPKLTMELLHQRLGHANYQSVKKLIMKGMVRGVTMQKNEMTKIPDNCPCCIRGKMKQNPFPKGAKHANGILDLVHSDLWGKAPVMSQGGKYYLMTFTDDKSRYSWDYYLHFKNEAFMAFKHWLAEVERQTGRKLKVFRSDNGGEYVSKEWELFLKDHSIIHQTTVPRTPQQDGVSERLNLMTMD